MDGLVDTDALPRSDGLEAPGDRSTPPLHPASRAASSTTTNGSAERAKVLPRGGRKLSYVPMSSGCGVAVRGARDGSPDSTGTDGQPALAASPRVTA